MNILKKSITYRLVSARKRIDSSSIGHAGMALRYLWAGLPCRRSVRSPPLPRGDGSEVPVGRGAVPKTGQKNALPHEDVTEVPVGRGPVPKTGQKTPFVTRECH